MYQGQTIGVWVDAQDHVWIIHRADSLDAVEGAADQNRRPASAARWRRRFSSSIRPATCCGTGAAGRPGLPVAGSNHGIYVDNKGNVWIGGNGAARRPRAEVHPGRQVRDAGRQEGRHGRQPAPDHFFQVAKMFFDAQANEIFVADGYGNKRVAVIDAETGKIKRFWGAYGNRRTTADAGAGRYNPTRHLPAVPQPGALRRRVGRRPGLRLRPHQQPAAGVQDRRQVRARRSTSQRDSRGDGSVWDVAFSTDPQQRFLYVADGRNQKLRIFDRAVDDRADQLRQGRPLSRASGIRCTTSRPTRRATCTRRKPIRAGGCSASCTRGWRR